MNRRMVVSLGAALLAAIVFLTALTPAAATGGSWCSALAAGSPIIDVIGDSTSAATSVDNASLRWPNQLGASLQTDRAPGTQIWTGGAIPGSATADYLPGAKYANHVEFTVHGPNLIMLGLGINDWAGGVPPLTYQAQYQQIIDRIRELAPDATIMLWHEPWVYTPELLVSRPSQAPYRDVAQSLAVANGLVYVATEWPFAGDDPFQLRTPDGVHQTAAGQNVLFATFRAAAMALCPGRV